MMSHAFIALIMSFEKKTITYSLKKTFLSTCRMTAKLCMQGRSIFIQLSTQKQWRYVSTKTDNWFFFLRQKLNVLIKQTVWWHLVLRKKCSLKTQHMRFNMHDNFLNNSVRNDACNNRRIYTWIVYWNIGVTAASFCLRNQEIPARYQPNSNFGGSTKTIGPSCVPTLNSSRF